MTAEPPVESSYERDLREWNIPEEVLAVLLKDRTTGKNILWCTDDYASRGDGFGFFDEIKAGQITRRDDPVIRPRVDKCKVEQRRRSVGRAEVFTPAWICNKQNNLVDAAWFGWNKPDSSPFNEEVGGPSSVAPTDGTKPVPPSLHLCASAFNKKSGVKDADARERVPPAFPWKTSSQRIHFPEGRTWQEYVKAPRLELSCGEAPYLASRYDTVSGVMIPVDERIGILDRKLRIVTENIGTSDPQNWFYHAKRAVQGCYGFDWQGDNVLLARENVLATVVETFNKDFFGFNCSYSEWSLKSLLELAEIISWNIWQMDGIRFVVPMSCKPEVTETPLLDGTVETHTEECPGCRRKDNTRHTGTYCKIMDWDAGEPIEFRSIAENGGGHGQ